MPKKIFLTFDDGPGPKTVEIAELLNHLGVKATFFMLGHKAEIMPGAAKRVAELGHEIGVHGYEHKFLPTASLREQVQEIRTATYILAKITGKVPRVYRAAYGRLSPESIEILKRALSERTRLRHVDWSYDTLDWQKVAQGKRFDPKEIVKKAKAGDVILFHDGAVGKYEAQAGERGGNLLRALPDIVAGLKARGMEFEPIEKRFQSGQRLKYKLRCLAKEIRAKIEGYSKRRRRR